MGRRRASRLIFVPCQGCWSSNLKMSYWRKILRFFCALQLLPALESASEEALIGGQAVLEGVMMRSPHAWGIAEESASEEALIGGQAVLEGVMMRSPHAWGIAVRKHTGDM